MKLDNLFNDYEAVPSAGAEENEEGGAGTPLNEGEVSPQEQGNNAEPDDKALNDAETNRIAAAARRKAEQESKAFRDEVDAFYRQNGYEGFADYKQKYEQEQHRRAMEDVPENLGFSGHDIDPMVREIVSNMPEFKAARELAEENLRTQQALEFEKQLRLISEIDPTIKTADDLAGMENADKFNDLVFNNGLSLVDAFRFVNMDRLLQQNEAKARQDTLNRVNSKSHMNPVAGTPGETDTVPDETVAEYKAFFPGISDEKIREHYKKNRIR